jgi:glutamine synthetase
MSTATLRCEYVWLDGGTTPQIRSKTKVITVKSEEENWSLNLTDFPVWGFDGSSTGQATTEYSDCVLRPVFACLDPNRTNGVIVLCDVLNTDLTPHESNYRARLIDAMIKHHEAEPYVGFEQEYFLYSDGTPLGWSSDSSVTPGPQGPYYCAVGADNVAGRGIAELHLNACINSALSVEGINAEVALGQWEYQIGGPNVNAVAACDHLWVSRFLLHRVAESQGVSVSLDPKPVEGDWNGSGLHTNFSTKATRDKGGMAHITAACEALSEDGAIEAAKNTYGEGLERRLTGLHETCSVSEFRYGVSDRGASIRIPWHVSRQGFGYFEDRRPNSNADPYRVVATLVNTVCSAVGTNEG